MDEWRDRSRMSGRALHDARCLTAHGSRMGSTRKSSCGGILVRVARTCSVSGAVNHCFKPRKTRYSFASRVMVGLGPSVACIAIFSHFLSGFRRVGSNYSLRIHHDLAALAYRWRGLFLFRPATASRWLDFAGAAIGHCARVSLHIALTCPHPFLTPSSRYAYQRHPFRVAGYQRRTTLARASRQRTPASSRNVDRHSRTSQVGYTWAQHDIGMLDAATVFPVTERRIRADAVAYRYRPASSFNSASKVRLNWLITSV